MEIMLALLCCISFDSYIKPQLYESIYLNILSCISFDSYIKPQRISFRLILSHVVYLLTPTSNHNLICGYQLNRLVVYLLTPTSNHNLSDRLESAKALYIF